MIDLLKHPVTVVAIVTALVWLAGWIGSIREAKENFQKFADKVSEDIKEILNTLRGAGGLEVGTAIARRSRLQLTDLGERIADALRADAWAAELLATVEKEAKGKTAYEIQEISIQHVRDLDLSPEKRALVQAVAFDHGLRERQVRDVLGIVLRNQFLERFGLG